MNPFQNPADAGTIVLSIAGGALALLMCILLVLRLRQQRLQLTNDISDEVDVELLTDLEEIDRISRLEPKRIENTTMPHDNHRPCQRITFEDGSTLVLCRKDDRLAIVREETNFRLELSPERLVDIIKDVGQGRYRYKEIGGAGLNVSHEEAELVRDIFARLIPKISSW